MGVDACWHRRRRDARTHSCRPVARADRSRL